MLSKEEISIRLGVDSASMKSGIDSASSYLSSWRKRQKSEEEAYTDFWNKELKKREDEEVASAVRAATRSNEARRLWRERAEKRDSKSQTEIEGKDTIGKSIQLAEAQGSKLLNKLNKQVSGFAGNVISGAVMGGVMAVANVAIDGAMNLVDKLSDYMSKKFYDLIYGLNDELVKSTDRMHAESNTAGRTHENTAAEMDRLDAEEARRIFEAKSAEDRKTESAAKLTATNEELTAAKKAVEQAREDMKELRRLNKDNQLAASEGAKKIAEAEANVLKVRKENIQATKDYRQALKDIDSKVPKVEAPVSMPDNPHTSGTLVESPKTRDAMMQGIADYYSQIASDRQKYGLTSESEKFKAMSDSLYEAQKAASEEFVQKVSIVEVKE